MGNDATPVPDAQHPTSSETLRRAAALMRERAETAPPGPWGVDEVGAVWAAHDPAWMSSSCLVDRFPIWAEESGDHIASWHPAVALAVAELLDVAASEWTAERNTTNAEVLAVACAYLGEFGGVA